MDHTAWFTTSVLLQVTANFGPEFKYAPKDVDFQPVSLPGYDLHNIFWRDM